MVDNLVDDNFDFIGAIALHGSIIKTRCGNCNSKKLHYRIDDEGEKTINLETASKLFSELSKTKKLYELNVIECQGECDDECDRIIVTFTDNSEVEIIADDYPKFFGVKEE